MKFEEYELKTDQYGFKFAKNDVMLGSEGICFMCNSPTRFIEVYSKGHFCSDGCVDAFYQMYAEHVENENAVLSGGKE